MPEVGLGLKLERFALVSHGDVNCVVDIVDQDVAGVVLTAFPDFPLDVDADKVRQFVSAWRHRAELEPHGYEVRQEQREV